MQQLQLCEPPEPCEGHAEVSRNPDKITGFLSSMIGREFVDRYLIINKGLLEIYRVHEYATGQPKRKERIMAYDDCMGEDSGEYRLGIQAYVIEEDGKAVEMKEDEEVSFSEIRFKTAEELARWAEAIGNHTDFDWMAYAKLQEQRQKEAEREHEEVERQKAHNVLKQADNTVVSLQTQKADLPPTKGIPPQIEKTLSKEQRLHIVRIVFEDYKRDKHRNYSDIKKKLAKRLGVAVTAIPEIEKQELQRLLRAQVESEERQIESQTRTCEEARDGRQLLQAAPLPIGDRPQPFRQPQGSTQRSCKACNIQ